MYIDVRRYIRIPYYLWIKTQIFAEQKSEFGLIKLKSNSEMIFLHEHYYVYESWVLQDTLMQNCQVNFQLVFSTYDGFTSKRTSLSSHKSAILMPNISKDEVTFNLFFNNFKSYITKRLCDLDVNFILVANYFFNFSFALRNCFCYQKIKGADGMSLNSP